MKEIGFAFWILSSTREGWDECVFRELSKLTQPQSFEDVMTVENRIQLSPRRGLCFNLKSGMGQFVSLQNLQQLIFFDYIRKLRHGFEWMMKNLSKPERYPRVATFRGEIPSYTTAAEIREGCPVTMSTRP